MATAIFRAGFLVVRYENTSYRDHKVEEVRTIFIDSRKFNRAELILEAETPPSLAELRKAREEVELIFGIVPQETPSAVAGILEQKIGESLSEYRRLQAWVDGAQFPAGDSFTEAPATLNDITSISRPNTIVKKFLDELDRFRNSISSINDLAKLYDSADRKKFNDMVAFLPIGRFLREVVDKSEMPNTVEGTDFLEKAYTEGNLLGRFPEAVTLVLQSIPELREKFNQLKNRSIDRISKAIESLTLFGKQAGLSGEDFDRSLLPLRKKKETLEEAEFDLHNTGITVQSLWTTISEIEATEYRIRQEIENIAIKKKGVEPPAKKPRRRIRVRELPGIPTVIRDENDLGKTLNRIEIAVQDALQENQEVELD